MTMEVFLIGLMVIATMTGIVTEAIKEFLKERNIKYYANALAGYVSVGLSFALSIGYIIVTETAVNAKLIVYLIALVLLSWLSAMIGYDKVIQAISQFKKVKGE